MTVFQKCIIHHAMTRTEKERNRENWGLCTRPHGIRGGCTLRPFLREYKVLRPGDHVLLFPESSDSTLPKNGKEYIVVRTAYSRKIIVWFQDVDDRNLVESMLPFRLVWPKKSSNKTPANNIDDIVGFSVLDREENKIGIVQAVSSNGVQHIVEITGPEPLLIPYVNQFIKRVDFEKKCMSVEKPTYV